MVLVRCDHAVAERRPVTIVATAALKMQLGFVAFLGLPKDGRCLSLLALKKRTRNRIRLLRLRRTLLTVWHLPKTQHHTPDSTPGWNFAFANPLVSVRL